MGTEPYEAITPGGGRSLSGRQILRIIALLVLALGVMLLARVAMKPSDPRKARTLVILGMFLGSNGLPLLLTLRWPTMAALVRATAAVGVLLDALVIVVMSVYALMFVRGGWSRPALIGVSASIGAAVICGLALLLRAEPLDEAHAKGAPHNRGAA